MSGAVIFFTMRLCHVLKNSYVCRSKIFVKYYYQYKIITNN